MPEVQAESAEQSYHEDTVSTASGLGRLVTGLTTDVTLSCGRVLSLNKMTIDKIAAKEQYIIGLRPSASLGLDDSTLIALLQAKNKEVVNAILKAVQNVVEAMLKRGVFATSSEVAEFEGSDRGVAYSLYMALSDTTSNKVKTLDDAILLYHALLNRRTDDLKNLLKKVAEFSWDLVKGNP